MPFGGDGDLGSIVPAQPPWCRWRSGGGGRHRRGAFLRGVGRMQRKRREHKKIVSNKRRGAWEFCPGLEVELYFAFFFRGA